MLVLWSRGGVALCAFLSIFSLSAKGAEPPLDLTEMESLVKEALGANPEIRSVRAVVAAAEARVEPAGALPDPMVSLSYENDGAAPSLGTMEMTRLQLMAQQVLPFPGKQRLAKDIARKDAERTGTLQQRSALTIAASVRRAYADLLEARESLRLVDEQAGAWRGIEEVTRGRYAAGLASQQDVLRAQSEVTRLLQQRRRDEAAEETALSEMRQLLFREPDAPIPTVERLVPGRIVLVPPSAETIARALDETPELKEIALTKERSVLSVDLAKRSLKPDFVASASYMNRGGLPLMWSAGVGVSIPLWAGQKQRPLIVEAGALASAAAFAEESLRRRVRAATEGRLIRLNQLAKEATLDAEGILVQDQLSVDAALASYRTGAVPFVTVLEALGTYFGDRRAALGRLANLLRAQADLEEFSPERSARSPMASASAAAAASASPKM